MRVALVLLAANLVWAKGGPICSAQTVEEVKHFISARGDKLYDGDKEFRFISFNIPNLLLVEDNFATGYDSPFIWPDEFEIADALESVRQLGGTVVRTYVLSVVREGSGMGDTVFVLGPGKFNEEAFQVLDLVLKAAREKGIRVIIPFVDQWIWMGGRVQYAGFRGKQPDDFWTDEQIIGDFEETVRFVLNRKNTLTGVVYRDDPTILGWETGNEIDCPAQWTKRIAAFIKSIDSKHLVIDGYSLHGVRLESLNDENVDVVTTHHYPGPGRNLVEDIRQAREKSRGKKPLFIGEFGFVPVDEIKEVLNLTIDEEISGALLWSLRFHHRDGGFYWHSEPLGAGLYKAYHWPGFASGADYEEQAVIDLMRSKAFAIRGLSEPPLSAPSAPKLLPIDDPCAISWQGSAGASEYDVFRATDIDGPWEVVGKGICDTVYQYVPLFHDDSVEAGQSYYYRIAARNEGGQSPFSNVVGPVYVHHQTLVDECSDPSLVASEDQAEPTTGHDRKTREDRSRLKINPGGHVLYSVEEPISEWHVVAFFDGDAAMLKVTCSADGEEYVDCEYEHSDSGDAGADYGYLRHVVLHGKTLPAESRFLHIELPAESDGPAQLSRVVIHYGADQ